MLYALLLKPHANVRYRQSLQKLSRIELECMLNAWDIQASVLEMREIAGEPFLVFSADDMSKEAWRAISRHSSICLAASLTEEGALIPIPRHTESVLPDELPQVLKYKGKTNADFTYMMLHCAKAASAFARDDGRLTVLDPMCGKGTTLFCALCEGWDALGVETDAKSLSEAEQYLERSLKWHRLKHKRTISSRTLSGGGNAKMTEFTLAADTQAMKDGDTLCLRTLCGDAARLREMVKPESVHLIVSDLPYGVQHAPREGGGMFNLKGLLRRTLPGCAYALKQGGAIAFSFNLNTLRRQDVADAMEQAGLTVLAEGPWADFSHWVEQAVDRDVVVAVKKSKGTNK